MADERGSGVNAALGRALSRPRLSRRALLVRACEFAGAGWAGDALFDVSGGGTGLPEACAAEAPKRGGKVTWAMTSDPVAVIPFGATNGSNFEVTSLMYESLL